MPFSLKSALLYLCLFFNELAIDIKPFSVLPDKAADLVQAYCPTCLAMARHKLNRSMVIILLLEVFDLKTQPLYIGWVWFEHGWPSLRVPGVQQVVVQVKYKRTVT